jgi:hypothetical protein
MLVAKIFSMTNALAFHNEWREMFLGLDRKRQTWTKMFKSKKKIELAYCNKNDKLQETAL